MQVVRLLAIGVINIFIFAFVLEYMLKIFDKKISRDIFNLISYFVIPVFLFIILGLANLIDFFIEHYNLLTTTRPEAMKLKKD